MLKCSICGKEFNETNVAGYAEHVAVCAKQKQEEYNRLNKGYEELDNLVQAQSTYLELRNRFMKNYPDLYNEYFDDDEDYDDDSHCGDCENCPCDGFGCENTEEDCACCDCDVCCEDEDEDIHETTEELAEELAEVVTEELVDVLEKLFGLKYKKR